MTKRQENAQETRRKIYTTACSLIEEKGFANVSVEDITNACGVAKGTFYEIGRVRLDCHSKLPQVRQAKLGRTNSGRSYIVKKSTYE